MTRGASMENMNKDSQFSFRTNSELLKKAKEIVATENYDMASVMNAVLSKIVEQNELPIELVKEKKNRREKIIDDLYAEIQIGRQSALSGETKPLSEVMKNYGL